MSCQLGGPQTMAKAIGALAVHERFFAITARRRIANLAVETLAENARDLFARSGERAPRPRRR
jgi:hypothetical protein